MLVQTTLQQMQDFSAGSMRAMDADNHHDYIELDRTKLNGLRSRVMPLLKPGQDFSKTRQLVDMLNDALKPGLDEVEKYVFSLHLHHLLDVERFKFGGQIDVHHPDDFHNSTAEHSVSVLLMSIDIFARTKDEMIRDNQQLQQLAEQMRGWFLRTVMHDTGELIMEFMSFGEEHGLKENEKARKAQENKEDQIRLEAEISEFFTRLALYCYIDDRHDVYTRVLNELRDAIVDQDKQRSKLSYTETARLIRGTFADFDFDAEFPGLNDVSTKRAIEKRINHFTDHYSHAEEFRGIGGRSVKIAQIVDGNKTFIDHAIRGMAEQADTVPYWLAQNRRILGAYDRSEQHLSDMFKEAADFESQKRIAREVAKENLRVLIEHICIAPPVLNRRDKDKSSDVNVLPADPQTRALNDDRIAGLKQLIDDEVKASAGDDFRHAASDVFQRDTISARTQLLLYASAFANDEAIIDKRLFETPLVYADDIAQEWEPFIAILDYAMREELDLREKSTITHLRGEFKFDEDIRYPDTIGHISRNADDLMRFFEMFDHHQKHAINHYAANHGLDIRVDDLYHLRAC